MSLKLKHYSFLKKKNQAADTCLTFNSELYIMTYLENWIYLEFPMIKKHKWKKKKNLWTILGSHIHQLLSVKEESRLPAGYEPKLQFSVHLLMKCGCWSPDGETGSSHAEASQ